MKQKTALLLVLLLLTLPDTAGGGPICYVFCLSATAGASYLAGPAILAALGFTANGIAAGSFASWMTAFGGTVPTGALFTTLQSMAASGSINLSLSSFGGLLNFCSVLCAPFP